MSPRNDRPLGSGPAPARPVRAAAEDEAPIGDEWGARTLLDASATKAAGSGLGPSTPAGSSARRSSARGSSALGSSALGSSVRGWSVRGSAVGGSSKSATRSSGRAARGRPHRVPFAVLLVGVIALGMCALLALNTATAASEVRERRVDAANSSLSAKQEALSRAVAVAQAPAQLALMAARLGLVPAGSPAFLRLNADGTVTVLGAPAKVPTPPVPLTPAQVAAAKAALAKAALLKAAKDKAAAQAKALAAKAKAAAMAKALAAAKAQAAAKAKAAKTTPPSKTQPTKTPPSKTPPTKAPPTRSPSTSAPPKAPPTKPAAVPTVTLPGGPR